MANEIELIESILVHAEDELTNRSWQSDDVGWKNLDISVQQSSCFHYPGTKRIGGVGLHHRHMNNHRR